MINVIKVQTSLEASVEVAETLIEQIKEKPNSVLGFATGSSPLKVYKFLINDYKKNLTSWKNVTAFNLDEYIGLSKDHNQSYAFYMKDNLFNHVNIDENKTYIPSSENEENVSKICHKYEENISKKGPIDIQLLGVGVNGHIGFNEPGSDFDSLTRKVELVKSTLEANSRFFKENEKQPTTAITMGIKTILKANKIILLAFGESKKEAIQKLMNGKKDLNWPITALLDHKDVIVYTDCDVK